MSHIFFVCIAVFLVWLARREYFRRPGYIDERMDGEGCDRWLINLYLIGAVVELTFAVFA